MSYNSNKSGYKKVLILGFYDISYLPSLTQYVVLCIGLLVFMCLYGYYQELVAYGFFNRKLAGFSTFLHFLGCFLIAHIQRYRNNITTNDLPIYLSTNLNNNLTNNLSNYLSIKSISQCLNLSTCLTMGVAPFTVGLLYYSLLVILKTTSQGLTNYSMTQINYPAKVLFKSANPIINMFIGLIWFRRNYPMRDYIVVLLLVSGLYVFLSGDAEASPEGTRSGILLVTISMFCGASVPMVQEHCMNKFNATVEDLLYHSFLGSTIISFIFCYLSGELREGNDFLFIHADLFTWISLINFCIVGYIGSNFSTNLTLKFGSLINGITNTARKAVTLGLSFLLFPSRNHLTFRHIIGAVIFFSGLIVRIIYHKSKKLKNNDIDNDLDSDTSLVSNNDLDMSDKISIDRHIDNKIDRTNNIIDNKFHRYNDRSIDRSIDRSTDQQSDRSIDRQSDSNIDSKADSVTVVRLNRSTPSTSIRI